MIYQAFIILPFTTRWRRSLFRRLLVYFSICFAKIEMSLRVCGFCTHLFI